jgi:hypothetical protein
MIVGLVLTAQLAGSVWQPVERPVVAASIEASIDPDAVTSRAQVVEWVAAALPRCMSVQPVILPASTPSVCGADMTCRLDLARSSGSSVLVVLYVEASKDSASFNLEVLSATTARTLVSSAGRWEPGRDELDADGRAFAEWLCRRLDTFARRTEYQARTATLRDVPLGAVLSLGNSRLTAISTEVVLARIPVSVVEVYVEPLVGEPFLVRVEADQDGASLMTSSRQLRRATFWLGAGLVAVGVGLVAASATRSAATCVRSVEGPADACASTVLLGNDDVSRDGLLAAAVGIGAAGLTITSVGLWETGFAFEAPWWAAAGGAVAGGLASGLVFAMEAPR